jgi:hypothetical protein
MLKRSTALTSTRDGRLFSAERELIKRRLLEA